MSAATAAKAPARTSPVSDPTCQNMAHRIGPVRAPSTAKRRTNGVDLRRRDVLTLSVAHAHNDAERGRTDADVVRRYATADRPLKVRTVNDWHRIGPPEARAFAAYLLTCSDPFRLEANVRATIKQRALSMLSNSELIDRYRELLALEPRVEADDRVMNLTRGACWMKRAAASERDAAIDAEKAACEREFAARGITEAEVFGR